MTPHNVPHLCGGILFDLLLETRKPRRKARDKLNGGSDGLTAPDVYLGFMYIVTGEDTKNFTGDALEKSVSNYKKCESSSGTYMPFTKSATQSAFDSAYKRKDPAILERTAGFIESYLNFEKCEWFVRVMIELMQADGDVNDDTLFSVDYGKSTAVKDLLGADRILFLPFLASVIHYVVMNCPDCESGRPTFEKWYSQASKRSEWKFREDNHLGDSIRPMNVDMDLTIPEPADTEPETPQEEEDECAESAEEQQADETKTVDAEIADEIPEDDTASAPNVTIIEHQTNIAHDESKTFNIKDSSVTFNL